jgi:hypothetical protein
MSYFEPSRRPFERRRLGSWTDLLDGLRRRPPRQQTFAVLLLAVYVAAAAWLCGAGLAAGAWTGVVVALALAGLALLERNSGPLASRIARMLFIAIATPSLLVPAIVFVAIGFWLLISLPLWLYRH